LKTTIIAAGKINEFWKSKRFSSATRDADEKTQ